MLYFTVNVCKNFKSFRKKRTREGTYMRGSRVSKGAGALVPNHAINVALCPPPWSSLLNRGQRLFACTEAENIEETATTIFLRDRPLPMVKSSKSEKEVVNNFDDSLITSFCSLT